MTTETRAHRVGEAERRTLETDITVRIDLDGTGEYKIDTGVPFLDHMLASFARHGHLDLQIKASGDTHIDDHHTVEDVALTLGRALRMALGSRDGIARFGSAYAPMDEALARVVVDVSGRPYTVFEAPGLEPYAGRFQTVLVGHFFRSLAQEAGLTLHAQLLYGCDPHHCCEALYKSLGICIREAVAVSGTGIPSTKGVLE